MNAVSIELKDTISDLMSIPELESFYLGGGTNLALKYGYRISTDIDLFSKGVVGSSSMNKIKDSLLAFFPGCNVELLNSTDENMSFVRALIPKNSSTIKLDIIQNLPLMFEPIVIDGIRLIHDLDIATLKMNAIGGRGTRKDFYDFYFLCKKYGIEKIYEYYLTRKENFPDDNYRNLFNSLGSVNYNFLKDLSPLANFRYANDVRKNKVDVIDNDLKEKSWHHISKEIKNMVKDLAAQHNLLFKETDHRRSFYVNKKSDGGFKL